MYIASEGGRQGVRQPARTTIRHLNDSMVLDILGDLGLEARNAVPALKEVLGTRNVEVAAAVDQKLLYRRLERRMRDIRTELEGSGLASRDVLDLIGRDEERECAAWGRSSPTTSDARATQSGGKSAAIRPACLFARYTRRTDVTCARRWERRRHTSRDCRSARECIAAHGQYTCRITSVG